MKYLLLVITLAIPSSAFAQQSWHAIPYPAMSHGYCTPFFLNDQYGFIANGVDRIIRTTDGGRSWEPTGQYQYIHQGYTYWEDVTASKIYFVTPSHIFATSGYYGVGIFESLDSGRSWSLLAAPGSNSADVCTAGNRIFTSNGYMSTDWGKHWQLDTITYPFSPYLGVSNLDASIVLLGATYTQKYGCIYSTDTGSHWRAGQGFEVMSAFAFPHRQEFFATEVLSGAPVTKGVYPDSGVVMRSTNTGATWQKVFPTRIPTSLSGGISGSGCTLYAQCKPYQPADYDTVLVGLYRSTDYGNTWDSIIGPTNYARTNISACRRGAVCFACDSLGRLWKFTDSSKFRSLRSDVSIARSSATLSNDTLFAQTCDSTDLHFTFFANTCDMIRIDSVTVTGIAPSTVRIERNAEVSVRESKADSIRLVFTPNTPGNYPITVRISFVGEDWTREDTTISLVYYVRPNPPVLIINPNHSLNLGRQLMCDAKTVTSSFIVRALGCDPVHVKRIVLAGDSASERGFSFTNVDSFLLANADGTRKFKVSFEPKRVGVATALILFETATTTDTLMLSAEGVRDPVSLLVTNDTIKASASDTVLSTISIDNQGCRFLVLDSIQAQQPLLIPQDQFVRGIAQGFGADIDIRCLPGVSAPTDLPITAHFRVFAIDTVAFDTTVVVHIEPQDAEVSTAPTTTDLAISSIYPDPATDEIIVASRIAVPSWVELQVCDDAGRTLVRSRRWLDDGTSSIRVPLTSLPPGAFILRIRSGDGSVSRRFVRARR